MYAPEKEAHLYAGAGAFEVVRGKDGHPVKYKDQLLMEKRREIQEAENRRDEELARRQLTAQQDKLEEATREQARNAKIPLSSFNSADFGLSDDSAEI